MKTICPLCTINRGVYNVIAPNCLAAHPLSVNGTIKLCPSCFQLGIDMDEIKWLGDKPYGICSECLAAKAS